MFCFVFQPICRLRPPVKINITRYPPVFLGLITLAPTPKHTNHTDKLLHIMNTFPGAAWFCLCARASRVRSVYRRQEMEAWNLLHPVTDNHHAHMPTTHIHSHTHTHTHTHHTSHLTTHITSHTHTHTHTHTHIP